MLAPEIESWTSFSTRLQHYHLNINTYFNLFVKFQNTRKDDGKTHVTKGKGGGAMHKDHTKPSMDTMSETSQMVNVADSNGYSVPVQVQGSNDYSWTKRRKQDASSTLSDGSRSKISALDPHFAKGTYDLTKQRISMDFDPKELMNQVNIISSLDCKQIL